MKNLQFEMNCVPTDRLKIMGNRFGDGLDMTKKQKRKQTNKKQKQKTTLKANSFHPKTMANENFPLLPELRRRGPLSTSSGLPSSGGW